MISEGIHARGRLATAENLLLVLSLALLTLLPLAEILLRKCFQVSIPGAHALTQNLTLIIGMIGGAVAARENRLLAMSGLPGLLKGKWKSGAAIFSSAVAAALTVFLCVAGYQFVDSEKEGGAKLVGEIPIWIVELVLPIGFALVAWRLIRHSADKWKWRALTLALAGLVVWFALKPPLEPEKLVWPCLIVLLLATALGSPIFVMLGGAALILFWGDDLPIASVAISQHKLVTDASLPAIPLFTLAGYFLAEGGASQRLLRVFQALAGHLRGGPAIVTCLVCAFFTTFTGASGVTILALGGILMPVLVAARYSERNALGLVTSAGSLGLLFPPCLPLILYTIIANHSAKANLSIREMFLGGIVPGILLLIVTALLGIWQAPKEAAARPPFSFAETRAAMWGAKWELLLPVVAFVGLFGGFATAVETAALTALYAFFMQTVIHRELKLTRDVPRVMTECGLLMGGVLLILGVAYGFTNYLVDAQIPGKLLEWAQANVHSKWLFLLGLNLVLIFVGGLIEIYAAIVVVVPLLVPVGTALGLDPIHLGIIFLANMELGFLAPPIGLNLLLSSYRFKKPIGEVIRSVLPMLAVLFIGVLLITYIPALTTALPRWVEQWDK
jgi:C4-dicarboxylate transporter DctM subunit